VNAHWSRRRFAPASIETNGETFQLFALNKIVVYFYLRTIAL
jgi:hypothetical protein